ncbi:MAG TPA: capsular biosynthesis protein [Candidatus Syntrophosphaera sp.]|jgi:protein-tyrosine phosphatase|nr:capsular biosynthesis protein [Candidatus Syntrophosphaera sp.]
MIDIHCHLLPQIDDGSDSEEKSLDQLKLMAEGGISDAFLTSHFMPGHYQYQRADYDAKLLRLRELAKGTGLGIRLHPGFEIYLHPFSLKDIEQHNLRLGNSRYILVESDLNGLPTDFYENLYPLLRKGYKPILAHAERYVSIMKNVHDAKDLIRRDIYMQVNAGSLLGLYGEKVRQTAWLLLRNGWAHFLASDDHAKAPYGAYFQALELLMEELDPTVVQLLTQDFPAKILAGENVPFKYVYLRASHESRRKKKSWLRRIFG